MLLHDVLNLNMRLLSADRLMCNFRHVSWLLPRFWLSHLGLRILNREHFWLKFRLLVLHVGGLRLNFRLGFELPLRFCQRDHRLWLHLRLCLFRRRLFFFALRLFLLSSAHDLLSVLLTEAVEVGVQAIDEDRLQS